jgi:hypothetical protein
MRTQLEASSGGGGDAFERGEEMREASADESASANGAEGEADGEGATVSAATAIATAAMHSAAAPDAEPAADADNGNAAQSASDADDGSAMEVDGDDGGKDQGDEAEGEVGGEADGVVPLGPPPPRLSGAALARVQALCVPVGVGQAHAGHEGGCASGEAPPSQIDVVVPEGCTPGMEFAVSIEGTTFNVTVPDDVSPGETITVEDLAGALTLSLDAKVLKRLCIANDVHCSSKATRQIDREKELLQRLQSVAKHGRPGPCPRCESILRVVSDDDGLRLECPTWRGGEGHRKPCGACAMPRSLVGQPAY